jgi:hypothetical protein
MRKLFLPVFVFLFFLLGCNNETKKEEASAPASTTETKSQPAEFADAKYAQVGKDFLANMSAGDMESWGNSMADNVVWLWNNGDSVAGKQAVIDYWKNRRATAIDSITFSNDIWLAVKVNKPQKMEQPGVWLLGWYFIQAKYKTGKSMSQWSHIDYHFDANDKVDRVIQYLDRAPINAAMAK